MILSCVSFVRHIPVRPSKMFGDCWGEFAYFRLYSLPILTSVIPGNVRAKCGRKRSARLKLLFKYPRVLNLLSTTITS